MYRFLILLILASCIQSKQESITSGGAGNPNAPSRWAYGSFPKTLKFSNSFSAAEIAEMKSAADAWTNKAGAGAITFYSYSSSATGTVSDKGNVSNLDSLMDHEFGVYRSTLWNDDLERTALAVTQIFGVRKNLGDSDEYIEIVEADVLINDDIFNFAPAVSSGYDLFSVVLHEFGHFLGLPHASYSQSSVMVPTIGLTTFYDNPKNYDINNIHSKYGIGGATGMSARSIASVKSEEPATHDDVLNSGNGVRITLELLADGQCVHKINGTRVGSHPVKILKK